MCILALDLFYWFYRAEFGCKAFCIHLCIIIFLCFMNIDIFFASASKIHNLNRTLLTPITLLINNQFILILISIFNKLRCLIKVLWCKIKLHIPISISHWMILFMFITIQIRSTLEIILILCTILIKNYLLIIILMKHWLL